MSWGLQVPVSAPISCSNQCHRNRKPPSANPGTDFAAGMNTPVRVAADATVIRVSHVANQPQGRHVWVRLDNGAELQYMHFQTPQVRVGQRVVKGQSLGLSGTTGQSTGPHVHVSLWYQGRNLDFMLYVGSPMPPNPHPEEYPEMFFANVNGSFFLVVPQGSAKPRGVVVGGDSGALTAGIPIVTFTWGPSIDALKRAVDGIG